MRVEYKPPDRKFWSAVLTRPQRGGIIIGFKGDPYQRGAGLGNILKGLFRMILPIAKKAGKAIGIGALEAGSNVAADVLKGRNLKKSLKKHGGEAAGKLVKKGAKRIVRKLQTGKGLGIRGRGQMPIKGKGSGGKIITRKRKKIDALV